MLCNFEHFAHRLHPRTLNSFATKGTLLPTFNDILNCKMYYLSHLQKKKFVLCHVWIRSITAYLLCAQLQSNALLLQFWCLSNALNPCSKKFQHACIILSQFTRKSKYAVINLQLLHLKLWVLLSCMVQWTHLSSNNPNGAGLNPAESLSKAFYVD